MFFTNHAFSRSTKYDDVQNPYDHMPREIQAYSRANLVADLKESNKKRMLKSLVRESIKVIASSMGGDPFEESTYSQRFDNEYKKTI